MNGLRLQIGDPSKHSENGKGCDMLKLVGRLKDQAWGLWQYGHDEGNDACSKKKTAQ